MSTGQYQADAGAPLAYQSNASVPLANPKEKEESGWLTIDIWCGCCRANASMCACARSCSLGACRKELEQLAPYVAEFIGTFLLVFIISMCSQVGITQWNPIAIGFTLMVNIYAFAPISGGIFNPAVAIALCLCNKIPFSKMIGYILVQMCAAILGVLIAGCIYGTELDATFQPKGDFGWGDCFIVETLYTALLCFVVLNVASARKAVPKDDSNQYFGVAIGFAVVAGGFACGSISGGSFNPAVTVGFDICHGPSTWAWAGIFCGYEVLGSLLAAGLFVVCRPEDYETNPQDYEYRVRDQDLQDYKPPLFNRIISEAIGTFVLVMTVGLCLSTGSSGTAFAAAAVLASAIYSLGSVSGGHFNPAVTLGVVLSGRDKCSFLHGAAYILIQLIAGICGGFLTAHFHLVGPDRSKIIGTGPSDPYSWPSAILAEMAYTFVLAYIVLSVATVDPPPYPPQMTVHNFSFALCIGFAVLAGGTAIGPISGGQLNPAVAFALSTENTLVHPWAQSWATCLIYSGFQLAGGALAAIVFSFFTHPPLLNQGK